MSKAFKILILTLLPCQSFAAGFTVYADMQAKDKYGASVRLDMGTINYEELRRLSVSSPEGQELLPNNSRDVRTLVVVPSSAPDAVKINFADAIKEELSTRFGSEKFFLEVLEVNVEAVAKQATEASASIKDAQTTLSEAERKAALGIANAMIAKNEQTVSILRTWASNFRYFALDIKNNPKSRSMFYGSLVGVGSSIGPVFIWLSTTGGALGIAQALTTAVSDQINTTLSTRLIRWETEHQFPFWKKSRPVRFYNSNVYLRALAVNFSISSATGFLYRTFSWLASPSSVASPTSVEFLTTLGGMNMASSALTSASDVAIRTIRKKGIISQRVELLANSTLNFTAQMNNLMLGMGATEYLPYGIAIEWGAKVSAVAISKLLPTKGGRFVIMHPELDKANAANVRYLLDLEETASRRDISPKELRQFAKQLQQNQARREKWQRIYDQSKNKMRSLKNNFMRVFEASCRGYQYMLSQWW